MSGGKNSIKRALRPEWLFSSDAVFKPGILSLAIN